MNHKIIFIIMNRKKGIYTIETRVYRLDKSLIRLNGLK